MKRRAFNTIRYGEHDANTRQYKTRQGAVILMLLKDLYPRDFSNRLPWQAQDPNAVGYGDNKPCLKMRNKTMRNKTRQDKTRQCATNRNRIMTISLG